MLDPLFERYQVRMEAALEDFAAEEGLNDPTEIIDALKETRDERDEWKKLDKMIDTMTKKEEFFIMVRGWTARRRTGERGRTSFLCVPPTHTHISYRLALTYSFPHQTHSHFLFGFKFSILLCSRRADAKEGGANAREKARTSPP